MTAFTGVKPTQVGEEYDFTLAFDNGSGTAQMYGYLLHAGTEWDEAPNIEDEKRIVTIDSPNYSDRFTFYPKVTQDDWSGGEGQEFFIDPTRYYQSVAVNPTKPGRLSLSPSAVQTSIASFFNTYINPMATDGTRVLVGGYDGGGPNVIGNSAGTKRYLVAGGTPAPVQALEGPQGGIFVATRTGTSGGIYRVATTDFTSQPAVTKWGTDIVQDGATQALAYQSTPAPTGSLVYIKNDNTIQQLGSAGGSPVQLYSGLTMEQPLGFLASSATGLLFATQQAYSGGADAQMGFGVLYSFDGVTATRVFDFEGIILAAHEMNGVTYLLGLFRQVGIFNFCFTLMAYSNGQLTTIFDQRYAAVDFQPTGVFNPGSAGVTGDGRFLYIGWPSFYGLMYDTVRGAFIRCSSVTPVQAVAHSVFPTATGIVDVTAGLVTTNVVFNTFSGSPTTGTMTLSWFDYGTPGIVKAFRCIEVEMEQPFPVGATVTIAFRLDQQQAWTPVTNSITLPNGNIQYLLPLGSKGYRIQLQITLNAGSGTSPVLRSIALTGNAARVWKVTAVCARQQQKRNGSPDDQGTATDLLANLISAYKQGGYVTLYIPDPTNPAGTGGAPYVSQATAKIEEYNWHTRVSPGMRVDNDNAGFAMEALVDLTLAEQL